MNRPDGLQTWLEQGAILSLSADELLLGIGAMRRLETRPSDTEWAFYAPDFFLNDSKPWLKFEETRKVSRKFLVRTLAVTEPPPSRIDWKAPDESGFRGAFSRILPLLKEGELKKIVPVVFETGEADASSTGLRQGLLRHALAYSEGLPVFIYGFWNAREGMIGATPEILIERDGASWSTMALAGTRRDSDDRDRPPLLEDPKERREHQLVIDGIADAVSPLAQARAGETGVVKLPALAHLRTPIELRALRERSLEEWVRALHPTPALGALPRETGLRLLQNFDQASPTPRARFGAPFGADGPDRSRVVVAIRNLQWKRDSLLIGAGCGVIPESDPAREWKELQAKLGSVKRILGL